MAFSGTYSFSKVLNITMSAYLLEIVYAGIFVFPAWLFIIILKRHERIDAYDYKTNFNPFILK